MLKLLRSPQFPDDLEETLRGEILLFWILVLTGGYGLVGLSMARALRPLPFLELFSIPTITCLTAYTLLQQRKITAVAITLCGGGLAALMFSTYHGGGLMAPGLYALLVPVVIAGFTLNRLAMSVLFSAILTYIVFLTWAQTTGRLPDPIYVQPLVNRALVIVLVIGGIGVMVWWSTRHTESVLKMLESENKERREAERQVRLLNQTLEERVRERTADLDAFTAMVAHDLRGPIITVGGYASLLKEKEETLDEESKLCVARVTASAKNLSELIDRLLEFSRKQRGALDHTSVDMTELVRTVGMDLLQSHGVAPDCLHLQSLPAANADQVLVRQVWTNLLDNALKYRQPSQPPIINVYSETHDGVTWYVVEDNGKGFDPTESEKVFDQFYRADEESHVPGSGVGLSTVKRIVSRHGGAVAAHGSPGRGARFSFSLSPSQAYGELNPPQHDGSRN